MEINKYFVIFRLTIAKNTLPLYNIAMNNHKPTKCIIESDPHQRKGYKKIGLGERRKIVAKEIVSVLEGVMNSTTANVVETSYSFSTHDTHVVNYERQDCYRGDADERFFEVLTANKKLQSKTAGRSPEIRKAIKEHPDKKKEIIDGLKKHLEEHVTVDTEWTPECFQNAR